VFVLFYGSKRQASASVRALVWHKNRHGLVVGLGVKPHDQLPPK
jgi:hypothetical protein